MNRVPAELAARVHDDQVIGMKQVTNVVHADRDESFRMRQIPQRLAAPADDDGFASMSVTEIHQYAH